MKEKAENNIKAVIFDLGYTLIYFNDDFQAVAYNSYLILADHLISAGLKLDRLAFADRFGELMRRYYTQRENDLLEQPVHLLVNKVLKELGWSDLDKEQVVSALHQMYLYSEKYWQLEPETHAVLQKLIDAGYSLGLISNASDAWDVNNLIDAHGLRPYFKIILISAAEGIRKPDRRIFERAAQRLETGLSEMVMVGDTLTADILGAHRSGMKAVWISKHVEDTRSLLGTSPELIPDAEIKNLSELPDTLKSFE